MKYLVVLAIVVGIGVFPGCEDLPCNKTVDQARLDAVDQAQLEKDKAAIDAYLRTNNIIALADPSGIRYVVRQQGFGGTPCLENQVSTTYVGKLMDTGKEFNAATTEFRPKDLILGWQIMLPQFPKGTKITLYIPSGYGYGVDGSKSGSTYIVPPNANLIFELEIKNIR